jgi:hypothetical protein
MDPDALERLVRIETLLSTHIAQMDARLADVDSEHRDHETRLRALERWRYGIPATLITAAVSVAIAVLGK